MLESSSSFRKNDFPLYIALNFATENEIELNVIERQFDTIKNLSLERLLL
jgi:hypothetical protein